VFVDYYEILQISPNADPETVHRIYRIQAQRFHPDNQESGNAEKFKLLSEAYQVLSDPERRTFYDGEHRRIRASAPEMLDALRPAPKLKDEVQRREEILLLLYRKRLAHPENPSLTLRDLERLLDTSKDQLEFSLWYLKESGYLLRTDSAHHTITIKGVQLAETLNHQPETPPQLDSGSRVA
jgi:curved DNA-binding protein